MNRRMVMVKSGTIILPLALLVLLSMEPSLGHGSLGKSHYGTPDDLSSQRVADEANLVLIQERIEKLQIDPCPDIDRLRQVLKSPKVGLWGKLERQSLKRIYEQLPKGYRQKASGKLYKLLFVGYLSFDEKDLERTDKMTREFAGLRYALYDGLFSQYPNQSLSFLKDRFNECSTLVAKMEPRDAGPQIEDLVSIAAAIAISYPEMGREIGALLDTVLLRGISGCGNDNSKYISEKEMLEYLRHSIIEFDQHDISAPSYFYAADMTIKEALKSDDVIEQIERLMQRRELIKEYLEEGALRQRDKAKVWIPFKKYSDMLMKLYEYSGGLPITKCTRRQLLNGASTMLRFGIQAYLKDGHGLAGRENVLENSQRVLFARVSLYLSELKKEFDYDEVARIACEFAKIPEVFDKVDAEQICAEVVRAHYLLGRPYEFYLDCSSGMVTQAELEKLKQAKGPYISLVRSKPCSAINW